MLLLENVSLIVLKVASAVPVLHTSISRKDTCTLPFFGQKTSLVQLILSAIRHYWHLLPMQKAAILYIPKRTPLSMGEKAFLTMWLVFVQAHPNFCAIFESGNMRLKSLFERPATANRTFCSTRNAVNKPSACVTF